MTETSSLPKGITVRAQYIKDLSFENPRAPESLKLTERPQFDMKVDIRVGKGEQSHYEVALHIQANAKTSEGTNFVVELVYAGLFALEGINEASVEPILLVYCPHLLFPYARRILSDLTGDGGFPPLMLEPIDFDALYRNRKLQADQAQKAAN